jgi:hypothetical protein
MLVHSPPAREDQYRSSSPARTLPRLLSLEKLEALASWETKTQRGRGPLVALSNDKPPAAHSD